ncbi:MAG: hypothetical protein HY936_05950 [Nitrosomonadales bacterium]|nr:hypothetical protein [Nitrosomonadales bacterium]
MHKTSSLKSAQQGLVLLEAMIAILIFSMGILAIVGLQAAMIKNTADSKSRVEASYIAKQRIGLMWSDPNNLRPFLNRLTYRSVRIRFSRLNIGIYQGICYQISDEKAQLYSGITLSQNLI